MKVTTYAWQGGAQTHAPEGLDDVLGLVEDPDVLVWADLLDPTEEDLRPLADALRLDPHAIEDALTQHERPKAVRYGDVTFCTLYAVSDRGVLARISMFAMRGGLITVRLGQSLDLDEIAHDFSENPDFQRFGCRALELTLLDAVVDGYTARVTAVDEQLDDLESILFENHMGKRIATDTFALHKQVGTLRRVVLPVRDIAGSLVRRTAADEGLRELLPYAEDVYDHTMRAADWVEGLRDAVESVRSTNLALMDYQMNAVMKKLTSWAAIIAVPTLITGYYGMNVPYPGDGKSIGYWSSVIAMVVLVAVLYIAFRRRNWL
ncbi:magnesium transporter CorA family protein [Tsukamurella sp. 8F]|uniref:magnesium transporter CorA family protein n=1 Tax=unclassified Tsukamurella TaxID=2633480 RepID=UPI0023B9B28C|nr:MULTISPECIES: magnesium transporter CorA family protein [unclassified Tsukamurella]MDF0531437.1 magnesium transporter CorA family protein [Tsukamurella sp. 8J]MDF0587500.1 magnesium transporter CorA family protein [Tsukamurella sp. 8F]